MYSIILRNKALSHFSLTKRCLYLYANKVLKIPSIAESIEEVTVSSYLKNQGDMVQEDEEILDVETHKGNFKVRSQASGKLIKYLVDVNADVKIGTEFAEIDTEAKDSEEKKAEKTKPSKKDTETKSKPKEKQEEAKPEPKKEKKETS